VGLERKRMYSHNIHTPTNNREAMRTKPTNISPIHRLWKANDSLNRHTVWSMLEDCNIPLQLMERLRSIYKNIKICLRFMDGMISEVITRNKRIRQGRRLSTILFNIYINKDIQEWKKNVTGGISECQIVAY
jgi:hypothetical protein